MTPHHYTFKKGQYQHTDNAGEKENEWEKGEGEGEGEGGREGCCLRSEALLCPDGVVLEDIVVYFPDLEHMPLMMSRVDEEIIEKITRASEYLSSLGVEVVRLQLPELADAVEVPFFFSFFLSFSLLFSIDYVDVELSPSCCRTTLFFTKNGKY